MRKTVKSFILFLALVCFLAGCGTLREQATEIITEPITTTKPLTQQSTALVPPSTTASALTTTVPAPSPYGNIEHVFYEDESYQYMAQERESQSGIYHEHKKTHQKKCLVRTEKEILFSVCTDAKWIYYATGMHKNGENWSTDNCMQAFTVYKIRKDGTQNRALLQKKQFPQAGDAAFRGLAVYGKYVVIHLYFYTYVYNQESGKLILVSESEGGSFIYGDVIYFSEWKTDGLSEMDLRTQVVKKVVISPGVDENGIPICDYLDSFLFYNDALYYKINATVNEKEVEQIYRYQNGKSKLLAQNESSGNMNLLVHDDILYRIVHGEKNEAWISRYDPKTEQFRTITHIPSFDWYIKVLYGYLYFYEPSANEGEYGNINRVKL